jgi:hypothetical protein
MDREYYRASIDVFLNQAELEILGELTSKSEFAITETQRDAWIAEIGILRNVLGPFRHNGRIYLEYSVPRLGRRIDAVILVNHVAVIIEFKVNAGEFSTEAREQVWDYALDMKNFHEPSHGIPIFPVLVATRAPGPALVAPKCGQDRLYEPVNAAPETLLDLLNFCMALEHGPSIDMDSWESGRYNPTPTIVEAAQALYAGHEVAEISRSDAAAAELARTSSQIHQIIASARENRKKAICLLTGVPGAGKTLIGLNVAATHTGHPESLRSVYLSGNGPLVAVLREALARDHIRRRSDRGERIRLSEARSEVKQFIQNVHHFRDECLRDDGPPVEHVVLFDEAQRAWNLDQTRRFMLQKRKRADFRLSEPAFLISCLDRHQDWAVAVCLVGGGQEINTGEAGIGEWLSALVNHFNDWEVYLSPRLDEDEYAAHDLIEQLRPQPRTHFHDDLHLSVSMRSFRAENVSLFMKQLLDLDENDARLTFQNLASQYPIRICRDLATAKNWVRRQARGSERFGLLASSRALRLKPEAIDIRIAVDPVQWFLSGPKDTRSSYYLEDAATEFKTQGLELDWTCVVWDADFRARNGQWDCWSFRGDRWVMTRRPERQRYQKNAYRVLLTRARQGSVIVVPRGNRADPTRLPEFYDHTYEYLKRIGLPELPTEKL